MWEQLTRGHEFIVQGVPCVKSAQCCQKSGRHLKILGARRLTSSNILSKCTGVSGYRAKFMRPGYLNPGIGVPMCSVIAEITKRLHFGQIYGFWFWKALICANSCARVLIQQCVYLLVCLRVYMAPTFHHQCVVDTYFEGLSLKPHYDLFSVNCCESSSFIHCRFRTPWNRHHMGHHRLFLWKVIFGD